ncbi:MAG: murein biosynthesis integral membrane protein MurJ [Alphaproteobacteria bacterium]|nr:MAG: murein biosynthesis integral membrane protein MurJ [Alphaproteobacteria bacterium]
MSLLRAAASVGGLTMASRLLGFVRDILLARVLGAGLAADAFFVAFKLPNFFRRLFAEGAFSAAFVPMFAAAHQESGAAAKRFAEDVLAALLAIVLLFSALMEALMPWVVLLITGGFKDASPEKLALAVHLTRLTFPFLMLISLGSLLAGVLNGLGRFAAAAAAPILLNLCMIGALLLWRASPVVTATALASAVSIAGLAQFVWLLVATCRAGLVLRLRWPRFSAPVKAMLRVAWPAAIGAGAMQVNLLIDTVLATRFLREGSLSYLYYADRLNQLPIGVIGVAVGTVLLPTLARQIAGAAPAVANHTHNRALELGLVLTIPAAVGLIVLAETLIRVLFQRGAFDAAATAASAAALAAYALGLPAYVLVKVLTPGFYARQDTATPVKIALIAVAANSALGIALMFPLAHVGLALATAISAWLNTALLYRSLRRRGHFRLDAKARRRSAMMLLGAGVMAVVLVLAALPLAGLTGAGGLRGAVGLGLLILAGVLAYGSVMVATGTVTLAEIKGQLRRGA